MAMNMMIVAIKGTCAPRMGIACLHVFSQMPPTLPPGNIRTHGRAGKGSEKLAHGTACTKQRSTAQNSKEGTQQQKTEDKKHTSTSPIKTHQQWGSRLCT